MMRLRTKLYLFATVMIIAAVMSSLAVGMVIINQIISQLNLHILNTEALNAVEDVNNKYGALARQEETPGSLTPAARESILATISDKCRTYRFKESGKIYLYDMQGKKFLGSQPDAALASRLGEALESNTGIFEYEDTSGRNMICAFGSTGRSMIKVLLPVPKSELYEKRDLYYQIVISIGTFILVIALTVSYSLSNSFTKNIYRILNSLRNVSKGDLDSQISARAFSSEHQELQDGINQMIKDLKSWEIEKERTLQEFSKHQKLESIGVLAGGIAHDFNNLLTAIRGNIQIAQMTSDKEELRQNLEDTEKATVRAMDLTRQLLTFSKGGTPIKTAASVSEILEHTVTFALRGTKSKPEFKIAADLRTVEVDTSQISQVIHNLILNAHQATPGGGVIRITAENKYIHSPLKNIEPPLKKGEYVLISIEDHGIGIEPGNLAKIFDPFFTTKPTGTGLGLSTSYTIVKKHGGALLAESEPGRGSTFHIWLPVSGKSLDTSEIPIQSHEYKGGGTALIMDDQESIRALMGKMLAFMKFTCQYAENGEQAIKLYTDARESGNPFDLVFMDLTIPGGLGGRETIEKLVAYDPGITAVVASGYSNDPVMSKYEDYGFKGRLEKPFKVQDLKNLVARLMTEKLRRGEAF
jgi:signal transduction histidine kinase/CheY-like chemotaxis protein